MAALALHLNDPRPAVRRASAEALGRHSGIAKPADPGMRISAAVALGNLGPTAKESIPSLTRLLNDAAIGEPTIMWRGMGKESVSNAAANEITRIDTGAEAGINGK